MFRRCSSTGVRTNSVRAGASSIRLSIASSSPTWSVRFWGSCPCRVCAIVVSPTAVEGRSYVRHRSVCVSLQTILCALELLGDILARRGRRDSGCCRWSLHWGHTSSLLSLTREKLTFFERSSSLSASKSLWDSLQNSENVLPTPRNPRNVDRLGISWCPWGQMCCGYKHS